MTIYGRNAVREALRGGRRPVSDVWATAGAARESWLRGVPVSEVGAQDIARRAGTDAHQGICAMAGPYPYADAESLLDQTAVLGGGTITEETVALLIGHRRGTIPAAEQGTFDLGKARVPVYVLGLVCFTLVCAALIFLPQFVNNGYVFLGLVALAGLWAATGLRKRLRNGDAGPNYAKTHLS